jgi:hypothetical protein
MSYSRAMRVFLALSLTRRRWICVRVPLHGVTVEQEARERDGTVNT